MLDKEKADTLGSPDGASVLNEEQGHESHLSFATICWFYNWLYRYRVTSIVLFDLL
jgi:hypothetical protein